METLEHPRLQENTEQGIIESYDRLEEAIQEDKSQHAAMIEKADAADSSEMVDTIFDYYKPKALTEGNTVETDEDKDQLVQHRNEQINNVVSLFDQRLRGGDEAVVAEYRAQKDELFADLGFKTHEANEILKSWASFNPTDRDPGQVKARRLQGFRQNFLSMAELDAAQPGAAAELYRRDGIRNFMRYQPAELLRQLHNENKQPVEVILSAADDWNGAYTSPESLTWAGKGIHMEEPVYVEASRPLEAFIRLAQIKERSGAIKRIRVSAHGSDDSLELRTGDENADIDVTSLQRTQAIKELVERGILDTDAVIILAACKGVSLGKEISRQTTGTVVATGRSTEGIILEEKGTDRYFSTGWDRSNATLLERGKRVDGIRRVRTLGRKMLQSIGIRSDT